MEKLNQVLGSGDMLRLFMNAQKSLVGVVQRYDASSPYASYRAKQVRAIDVVLAKLRLDVKDLNEEHIPAVVQEAADTVTGKIESFGEEQFNFEFAGVPTSTVNILTESAFLDFGNTIQGMRQDGLRAMLNKRKLQEKIIEGVIQGSSVSRTQTQLMNVLKEDGLTSLVGSNGREWKVEAYTNMLVRTQTMTAYNIGARTQMLNAGRMFGIFPTIPPKNREPDDPCWEWEKKKYVNLLKDPLPPQSTHPNCEHTIQPCSMEQLLAERPDLFAEAVAFYDKKANE